VREPARERRVITCQSPKGCSLEKEGATLVRPRTTSLGVGILEEQRGEVRGLPLDASFRKGTVLGGERGGPTVHWGCGQNQRSGRFRHINHNRKESLMIETL